MRTATERLRNQARSDDRAPRPTKVLTAPPPPVRVADPVPAAQLDETLRGATLAAVPPVVLLAVLAVALRQSPVGAGLACLFAAGAALAAACAFASAAVRNGSSPRLVPGRAVAVVVAAAFGGIAGAALFLACDPAAAAARPVVVAVMAAMLAAVLALGPLVPVALAFAVPLVGGAAGGLVRGGDGQGVASAALLLLAFLATLVALDRRGRRAARARADRLRVDEQGAILATLLGDAEADAGEWVWETDSANHVRRVTGAAAGTPAAALEGAWLPMMLRGDEGAGGAGRAAVLAAIAARTPFRNQVVAVRAADRSHWWRLTGKPVCDAAGAFVGYRGLGVDITASRDADARIAYLANYDSWTDLANRATFQAHAARQCEAAATQGRCGALLYLDLDGFKSVNDTFGHAAGDAVLKAAARRLTAVAPPEAIVARLGGDEFAIWTVTAGAGAEALADALIAAVAAPYDLDGRAIEIGASVGIALTPRHGTDPDDLLVRADLALYRAKAEGKGRWRLFVEAYELSLIELRKLEADLKLALARGEFELHYQPLVNLSTGAVVCFEALIRWHSPTRGLVSPASFIPAAEESGLISAIGHWALLSACEEAARWPGDPDQPAPQSAPHVAVNISPRHFRSPDFVGEVRLALQLSGLKPQRLEVEVTEGVFLDTSATAIDNLRALRKLGVRIALDDFGTGYSSLSYLINFPVDKIKIDRSFIRDFDREANRAVVDAILSLARRLGIAVTAEGVETAEQALALKLRRCDDIQGYLLGRPRPAGAVEAMLADVPMAFRQVIPEHLETPLGFALAMKKQAGQ